MLKRTPRNTSTVALQAAPYSTSPHLKKHATDKSFRRPRVWVNKRWNYSHGWVELYKKRMQSLLSGIPGGCRRGELIFLTNGRLFPALPRQARAHQLDNIPSDNCYYSWCPRYRGAASAWLRTVIICRVSKQQLLRTPPIEHMTIAAWSVRVSLHCASQLPEK